MPQGQFSLQDIDTPKQTGQFRLNDIEGVPQQQALPRPPAGVPRFIPPGLQPDQTAPHIGETFLGSQLIGIPPKALLENLGGIAANIINTAFPGGDVRRPDKYTIPTLTPQEEVGSKLATIGGITAAGMATGSAIARKVSQQNLVNAPRAFNEAAGVSAGRKGAQTAIDTGAIKVNPGNAAVRAMEAEGKSPQLAAITAKATPELQQQIYRETQNAGKALGDALSQSPKVFDIVGDLPLDNKKLQSAMDAAGIQITPRTVPGPDLGGGIAGAPRVVPSIEVTPLQAHALRSEIGTRIPKSVWNGTGMTTDMNEELKDAWIKLSQRISNEVPEVAPMNTRWQEAYLYGKALQHTLDQIVAGKAVPSSLLADTVKTFLKRAGIASALTGLGYDIYRRTQ